MAELTPKEAHKAVETVLRRLEKNAEIVSHEMKRMAAKKGVPLDEVHAAVLIAITGSYQHAGVPKSKFLAEARGCWDNVKNRLENEKKIVN